MKRDEPLPPLHQAAFRSAVASAAWATQRVALCDMFNVNCLTSKADKATLEDVFLINKTIRRLKHDPQRLFLPKFSVPFSSCRILVISDSSHGIRAQGCFLILLTPDEDSNASVQPAHVLQSKSWKLKRVSVSTLSAEAQALVEASNAAKFIQELILQSMNVKLPIDLRSDHCGLVQHCNQLTSALTDVRTELQIMVIKQNLGEQKDYRSLSHVTGDNNIADIGTVFPSRVEPAVRRLMEFGEIQNLG